MKLYPTAEMGFDPNIEWIERVPDPELDVCYVYIKTKDLPFPTVMIDFLDFAGGFVPVDGTPELHFSSSTECLLERSSP